jgi:hypothetical protein
MPMKMMSTCLDDRQKQTPKDRKSLLEHYQKDLSHRPKSHHSAVASLSNRVMNLMNQNIHI